MFDKDKETCPTPHIMEEYIKLKFIEAYNLTKKDKKRIIQDSQELIELYTNTTQLDIEIENLNDELLVISELTNRYEQTQEKHNELIKERDSKKVQTLDLKAFISNFNRVDDKLSEWNDLYGCYW